jgi:hypothetical protein
MTVLQRPVCITPAPMSVQFYVRRRPCDPRCQARDRSVRDNRCRYQRSAPGRSYAYPSVRFPFRPGNDRNPVPDCGPCTVKTDPNPPVGFPQSCPTLSRGFSRFASTKPPLVTSSSRPGTDVAQPAPKRTVAAPRTERCSPPSAADPAPVNRRRRLRSCQRREVGASRRSASVSLTERYAARCRHRRWERTRLPGSTYTARRQGPSRVRSADSRTPSVPPCARPSLDRT